MGAQPHRTPFQGMNLLNDVARVARHMLRGPARELRARVLPRIVTPASGDRPCRMDHVRVVGLFDSASGIGKSARLCSAELRRFGIPVSECDVTWLLASKDGTAQRASISPSTPATTSIYVLNPPMLMAGLIASGLPAYRQTYNIGYWAWELEQLPSDWSDALRFLDAIFVPSQFCASAVRRSTAKPVRVVPHPLPIEALGRPNEPKDAHKFRVLSVFNFGSSYARKNPAALIAAFRDAFGNSDAAELVLKTADGRRHLSQLNELRREINSSPNIRLIDAVWCEDDLAKLFRSADVYASLHRSEGFGLTIAEAILNETPVIATAWSGNTDFCDPELSGAVNFHMTALRDAHTDYRGMQQARWAEPDVASASIHLREVWLNQGAARNKARRLRPRFVDYLARTTYVSALSSLSCSLEECSS